MKELSILTITTLQIFPKQMAEKKIKLNYSFEKSFNKFDQLCLKKNHSELKFQSEIAIKYLQKKVVNLIKVLVSNLKFSIRHRYSFGTAIIIYTNNKRSQFICR